MLIECARCVMQHTDHCRDCVVSALVAPDPRHEGLDVDADLERALGALARAGLVGEIRMRRRLRSA